jgi:hypothetical protein
MSAEIPFLAITYRAGGWTQEISPVRLLTKNVTYQVRIEVDVLRQLGCQSRSAMFLEAKVLDNLLEVSQPRSFFSSSSFVSRISKTFEFCS